ncbi:hypothetical protein NECAME_04720 [Necator americanus]|uniref:Uncharacterized protein n=1 Tax=Necator americanus TaxID=51031 RepID=W2SMZ9_NECAM|nr:hypothetical protein NECAME_04720 [Necator americanus]ETN71025.1 hypothetical protein NECAME_04720 [Necator americanus]
MVERAYDVNSKGKSAKKFDCSNSFSDSPDITNGTVPQTECIQQIPPVMREQTVCCNQELPNTCDKFERFGAMVSSVLKDLHPDLANDKMASICMILFHDGVIVTQNNS